MKVGTEKAAMGAVEVGVAVLIIRVMQAALHGCPIRPDFCKGRIRFPEVRQAKASCDHALHYAPV